MSQPKSKSQSRLSAELTLMSKAVFERDPLWVLAGLLAILALAVSCSLFHAQDLLPNESEPNPAITPPAPVVPGASSAGESGGTPFPVYPSRPSEVNEASSELLLKIAKVLCCASIEFEENTENLTANGKSVLNDIAPFFGEHKLARLFIDGHTDALGINTSNLQLSVSRANSARNYLISRGVNAEQLIARGFGADQPIADNSTDEGRRRNRRIEFRL